jgi:hypothetical protein
MEQNLRPRTSNQSHVTSKTRVEDQYSTCFNLTELHNIMLCIQFCVLCFLADKGGGGQGGGDKISFSRFLETQKRNKV